MKNNFELHPTNFKDKGNTSENVYKILKENILGMNLMPGVEIGEIEVAEVLKVSRTPIREAFIKLRHEKLIRVLPKKGTFVSLINMDLVKEGAFLRQAMEKEVLHIACQNFPKEYLIRLKENLCTQKVLAELNNDYKTFHKLDNMFHNLIFEGCGQKGIWELIEQHCFHHHRIRLLYDQIEKENIFNIIHQHETIIELIEKKNKKIVEEIISHHLSNMLPKMEKAKEIYSDFFEK